MCREFVKVTSSAATEWCKVLRSASALLGPVANSVRTVNYRKAKSARRTPLYRAVAVMESSSPQLPRVRNNPKASTVTATEGHAAPQANV